jgi:tetratricopeptide (TPR) repeat protein
MAEAKENAAVDIDRLESDFRADPSNFVHLAKAYIERDLPVQAIQVCREGLKRAPQVPEGQLALAMAYYHNYDDARAEQELRKVLRSKPDDSVAHRTLGEIYLERQQEQKAIGELTRALEIAPGDGHTRALLESLDEKLPKLDSANGQPEHDWPPRQVHNTKLPPKPLWRAGLQLFVVLAVVVGFLFYYDHHVQVVTEMRGHVKEASKLIPRDNFDDLLAAEKRLDKALALVDDNEQAMIYTAQVHARLYRNHAQRDRRADIEKLLAWMKDEELLVSERYSLESLLQVADGQAEQAVEMLTEIVNRAIEKKDIFLNAEVFGARAYAQLALGQMQKAREDFSRASKFSSLSPHFQAHFANVYLREGNLGRALRYFKDAIRRNPDHVFSNLRRAYTYLQTGKNLEKAEKIIDDFMDRDKHPAEEFSPPLMSMLYQIRGEYALATIDEQEKAVAEAEKWADQAVAAFENNAEAWNLKGRLAALEEDGPAARQAFAKALEIDPRLPRIYFDRAESLFALGQKEEAVDKIKEFKKALEPTVAYHVKRGELLLRMDELERAQEAFQKAVTVDELDPKGHFWLARAYQAKAEKIPADDEKREDERRELFNKAREEYEGAVMLPGGETPEIYHQMGLIYFAAENYENALDKLAKSVMMMTKANEPPEKIAAVYEDIAKIFKELGGEEGEKQEQAYLFKADALRKGMTVDEVEKQWQEKQKKEKKQRRRRRRRRRR